MITRVCFSNHFPLSHLFTILTPPIYFHSNYKNYHV